MRGLDWLYVLLHLLGLALALAIIIVAMGISASLIAYGWPKFLVDSSTAEWLVAVGTIAAVATSLILATLSGRIRKKRARQVAEVKAIYLVRQLHHYAISLQRISNHFDNAINKNKYTLDTWLEPFTIIESLQKNTPFIDFIDVAIWYEPVGKPLMELNSLFARMSMEFEAFSKWDLDPIGGLAEKNRKILKDWINLIQQGIDVVNVTAEMIYLKLKNGSSYNWAEFNKQKESMSAT